MTAEEYEKRCEELVNDTAMRDCYDGNFYCGEAQLPNGYTLKVRIEDGIGKRGVDCISFTLEKDGGVVIYGDEFDQFNEGATEYINGCFVLSSFFDDYTKWQDYNHPEERWTMWDDAKNFYY